MDAEPLAKALSLPQERVVEVVEEFRAPGPREFAHGLYWDGLLEAD